MKLLSIMLLSLSIFVIVGSVGLYVIPAYGGAQLEKLTPEQQEMIYAVHTSGGNHWQAIDADHYQPGTAQHIADFQQKWTYPMYWFQSQSFNFHDDTRLGPCDPPYSQPDQGIYNGNCSTVVGAAHSLMGGVHGHIMAMLAHMHPTDSLFTNRDHVTGEVFMNKDLRHEIANWKSDPHGTVFRHMYGNLDSTELYIALSPQDRLIMEEKYDIFKEATIDWVCFMLEHKDPASIADIEQHILDRPDLHPKGVNC